MTPKSERSGRQVALLRGINVGGHRRVPMAELRTVLTDQLGLTDVASYIHSGNVVFSEPSAKRIDSVESIDAAISATIADHFGFEVPVVVRNIAELTDLLERSAEIHPPTSDAQSHDKRVMIGFLTAAPTSDVVAAIDPDRSAGDSVIVEGAHTHIRYASGQSSTRLTGDYLERVLGVGMTTRNLTTVRKLVALA